MKNAIVKVNRKLPGAKVAAQVAQQYRAAEKAETAALREIYSFGAMLLLVEAAIGDPRGGDGGGADEGLKGWLAANCPTVNYNTAMKYKYAAAKVVAMMGGKAASMAALAMQGSVLVKKKGAKPLLPGGDVIEVAEDDTKKAESYCMNAYSFGKLQQMYFDFMKKEDAKAKRKASGGVAESKLRATKVIELSDSAAILWGDAMKPFESKRGAFFSAARNLARNLAEGWLEELKMLCGVLEKRLKAND